MAWIADLELDGETRFRARLDPAADGIVRDARGAIAAALTIELAAQLLAAGRAVGAARAGGPAHHGVLARVDDARFAEGSAARSVVVAAEIVKAREILAVCAAKVEGDGRELAAMTLHLLTTPAPGPEVAASPGDPLAREARLPGLIEIGEARGTEEAFGVVANVARAHPVFDGHFPGRPVVPGALLVDAAVRMAEARLGTLLRLTAIDVVRFHAAVGPGAALAFDFRVSGPGGAGRLDWKAGTGGAPMASGRMTLAPR
jgi:3-hydroxymyristoyl/3-hydroxydecanoyl-(acyl carrier protein) dehydratase